MTRSLPAYRHAEDVLIDITHAERGFARDGDVDDTEAAALWWMCKAELLPVVPILTEIIQYCISIGLSSDGIRGHRPQRLERQAMARVLPFPAEALPDSAA